MRRILVQAILRAGVLMLGLPRLIQLLRSQPGMGRLLRRMSQGGRYSCLESSLLEISGHRVKSNLAIGIKKEEGRLLAHAWVEGEDESVDEVDGFKKIGTL